MCVVLFVKNAESGFVVLRELKEVRLFRKSIALEKKMAM